MSVSSKYIFQQGDVLKALGRTTWSALTQKKSSSKDFPIPGPIYEGVVPPRAPELVKTYIRHVGGEPGLYKEHLPPHLFPQWGFSWAAQTLKGLPYPLLSVVNGGCRLEVHQPLPNDEPIHISAQLVHLDDNRKRVVMHQRVISGTKSAPEAIVATMYPIVPLRQKAPKDAPKSKKKKEKPRVPKDVKEIDFWKLRKDAGLDFAKLTGDFNPIHWVPSYARMSGFKNTILHGFATMARAMEGLNQHLYMGATPLRVLDVQFTRPLVLPHTVGLYVTEDQQVFVGDAPGGPAYLVGQFSTELTPATRHAEAQQPSTPSTEGAQ